MNICCFRLQTKVQNRCKMKRLSHNAVQNGKQNAGTSKITCEFSKDSTDYNNNKNDSCLRSSDDKVKKSGNST